MANDVAFFHEPHHGEVRIEIGDIAIAVAGDRTTEIYLSLFGGNQDVDAPWWGNLLTSVESRHLDGGTEKLLREEGFSTRAKALRVEQQIIRDTQWMIDAGLCSEIGVLIDVSKSLISITADTIPRGG